jgi:hypothetical protein
LALVALLLALPLVPQAASTRTSTAATGRADQRILEAYSAVQ